MNDDLGSGFEAFLQDACTKSAVYVSMSNSELHTLQRALITAEGVVDVRDLGQEHLTLGRADYQRQFEAIVSGWPAGHDRY